MTRGLRALLHGVIDYAGMFPPARLPLDKAVRNYARFRQGEFAWMLGHFVVGAVQLEPLADFLDGFDPQTEKSGLAITCGGSANVEQWSTEFDQQIAGISSFLNRAKGQAELRAVEVKLPHPAETTPEQILDLVCEKITMAGWPAAQAFFEVTAGPNSMDFRDQIARRAGQQRPDDPPFGLKLRAGGLEASEFPSVNVVTDVIMSCEQHKCSWKATAGLHHPLRQFREEVNTKMHGFLNVLTAAVLADAQPLRRDQVLEIVADEDPVNFQLDDDGIAWREHRASVAEIEAARKRTMISFGSCDFEEPLADLELLGLPWLTIERQQDDNPND